MTSVTSMPKQSNGHFIILSSLTGTAVLNYSGASGSGASAMVGSFSPAAWATSGGASPTCLLAYQLLKDMGMTVMSSGRMFRKIAPVVSGATASPYAGDTTVTFGVSTTSATSVGANPNGALTGFIELGYEGFGNPTPVARYNSL